MTSTAPCNPLHSTALPPPARTTPRHKTLHTVRQETTPKPNIPQLTPTQKPRHTKNTTTNTKKQNKKKKSKKKANKKQTITKNNTPPQKSLPQPKQTIYITPRKPPQYNQNQHPAPPPRTLTTKPQKKTTNKTITNSHNEHHSPQPQPLLTNRHSNTRTSAWPLFRHPPFATHIPYPGTVARPSFMHTSITAKLPKPLPYTSP